MKTLSTVTHRPQLITATIFGALALSFCAMSTAADHSDVYHTVVHTVVKFADLDVSNPVDDATLYRRIVVAADKVCESYDTDDERDLFDEEQLHACVHKAIADAVTEADLPQLFAIYETTMNHGRR